MDDETPLDHILNALTFFGKASQRAAQERESQQAKMKRATSKKKDCCTVKRTKFNVAPPMPALGDKNE